MKRIKKAAVRKAPSRAANPTRKSGSIVAVRGETKRVQTYTRAKHVPSGERDWSGAHSVDKRLGVEPLLRRIQRALPRLERLLQHYDSHWGYEDPIYRFYHQSWKVYGIEDATLKIVAELQALAPGRPLDSLFMAIIDRGTPLKPWKRADNGRWLEVTAPMVEAFFHARFFLGMAVRYGKELKQPVQPMPSGWAALLNLYKL